MAGVGNDLQGVSPSQSRQRLLVEFDDPDICAVDNEEGRRLNSVEKIAGEVRTPTARNDRADAMREVRGRNERSRCSRAGAEQSERTDHAVRGFERCLKPGPAGSASAASGNERNGRP